MECRMAEDEISKCIPIFLNNMDIPVLDTMVNLKEKKLVTLNMTLIRLCLSLTGKNFAFISTDLSTLI